MKKVIKIIVFVMLLMAFFSCSSKQVVPKYYILEPIQEIQLMGSAKIPADVYIKPLSASAIYDQKRIVFRSNSNELQYYYYHMWAEKPSLALRYFIKNYFDRADVFKSCSINSNMRDADFFISGNFDKIERVKIGDKESLRLKMDFQFVEAETKNIIAEHSFYREEPIEEGVSMNLFSQTISRMLTEEMNTFLKKIETNYKRQGR